MSTMRPPQGGNAMNANRSPMNPTDAAFMAKTGQVTPETPIGQYLEQQFGIKWEDPISVVQQKMTQSAQKASPMGKVAAMAGQGMPQQPPQSMAQKPMPQGRKPMVESQGLAGLSNRLGA